jgi:hypothetical protein
MPDTPACVSAIADYLTFLARYPSFDALYWDCRHGWLVVPVALAGGWPRAGLSLGRAVFRGVLAALAVLAPLNLYWGFPVPVCEGLTALTLLTLLLAGPVCALVWLVPHRPVVASLLVVVAATLVFPGLRGDWGFWVDSAILTVLLAGLGIGVAWLSRRRPFLATGLVAAAAVSVRLCLPGASQVRVWDDYVVLAVAAALLAVPVSLLGWLTRQRPFAAAGLLAVTGLILLFNLLAAEPSALSFGRRWLYGPATSLPWAVASGDMTAAAGLAARDGEASRDSLAVEAARGRGDAANALRLLRQWGVALDPAGAAETALGAAVGQGHLRAVRYLLEAGADPNRRGRQGDAPLHTLLPEQSAPLDKGMIHRDDPAALARLLLAHGADPTLPDAAGQRPGKRAREQGLVEAADLLDAVAVAITP